MPHIQLKSGLPGIRGLFAYRLEVAQPLSQLAQVLLHDRNSLSPGERELIATYVSFLNDCHYCQTSHGAIAANHLGGDEQLVQQVKHDFEHADISEKLKALLTIAGKVQQGGKNVLPEHIDRARQHGATDCEIHDTVLIAAAFCMYNRYVDGLATETSKDAQSYRDRAAVVAKHGYMKLPADLRAQAAAGEHAQT